MFTTRLPKKYTNMKAIITTSIMILLLIAGCEQ